MTIIYVLYVIAFLAFCFVCFTCLKIKSAGIEVKDFINFIKAINRLDILYIFSKNNQKMTKSEQAVFLNEAEEIFDIFDKIPEAIWEDEYEKYAQVLDTYKEIKMLRWSEVNS